MPSPFDVLGIDSDADDEAIQRAYRRRVKETHPDHGGSVREFRRVQAAYEELASGERSGTGPDEATAHDRVSSGRHRNGFGRERRWAGDRSGGTDARVEYLDYDVLADFGWGVDDEDLFEKASAAGLRPPDSGRFLARADESLLQAAENRGFSWPYACRGGACANCAVAVTEGELSMPVNHILPQELIDRGIRLSCVGGPTTDEVKVVYDVKHLPDLDELRLPPDRFERDRLAD